MTFRVTIGTSEYNLHSPGYEQRKVRAPEEPPLTVRQRFADYLPIKRRNAAEIQVRNAMRTLQQQRNQPENSVPAVLTTVRDVPVQESSEPVSAGPTVLPMSIDRINQTRDRFNTDNHSSIKESVLNFDPIRAMHEPSHRVIPSTYTDDLQKLQAALERVERLNTIDQNAIPELASVGCAFTALAMVLQDYGIQVPIGQLAQDSDAVKSGANFGNLFVTARKHGLTTATATTAFKFSDLVAATAYGHPAIAYINTPAGRHAVVVDGTVIKPSGMFLLLRDPDGGEKKLFPADEFLTAFTGSAIFTDPYEHKERRGYRSSELNMTDFLVKEWKKPWENVHGTESSVKVPEEIGSDANSVTMTN